MKSAQARWIGHRVAIGRLHVVHRGVYAVGHTVLGRSGRWMAAVLACGLGAALSHASAAALWALERGEPTIIDVTTNRTGRSRPGIRIHRPRRAAETTTHAGIPDTTAARTILDLAATVTQSRVAELCATSGLPSPRMNQPVAGKEVDFLFPDHALIVEVGSWGHHKTRRAFEADRARDVITTRAGYRTLRLTDRQLTRQPHATAQAIRAVLADRRAA